MKPRLAAIGVALALIACGDPQRGRALLVGIDGASLRVVAPLLAAGRLPHLEELAREGVSGPLRAELPLSSPLIWNSIATGKRPAKHGIRSFVRREGDRLELLLSGDRTAHAIWNIASDAGLVVGVVNFWNTYPPERIRGVMVSDHLLASQVAGRRKVARAAPAPRGAVVFPLAWHARLAEILEQPPDPRSQDLFDRRRLDPRLFAHGDGLPRRAHEDDLLTRIALEIEAEIHPDLLLLLLPGIDRVSHMLWGNLEPPEKYPPHLRPTAVHRSAGAAALEGYYAYTDALIGSLLERYGERDLVMVVSDHGFEAGVRMGGLTGVHESEAAREGLIFARGPGVPAGAPAGVVHVDDITPTLLAWLGLALGEDMDGRPADFLDVPPPPRVATHDTAPVERLHAGPSGVEPEIVERLRDLGYVE